MTRVARLASVLLLVSAACIAGCSKKGENLVTLGDPATAEPGNPVTVGQLLMNTAGFLDKTVKLKAELAETRSESSGYTSVMVVSTSGPFELRVADKYRATLAQIKIRDTFVAIGTLASAGSESNPRLVFQVD